MKGKIVVIILLIASVLLVAWLVSIKSKIVSGSPIDISGAPILKGTSPKGARTKDCSGSGGTWLAEFSECEYVSSGWCADAGGVFSECESACRHKPDAEFCTLQCVPVCSL
jgi:hypothetical protein